MLGKALGFPSQQPLITVSHLLLARTEPFPKTVVMLSPGKCRALLALNTRVSAAPWLCPVRASLAERSGTRSWFGSIEDNRCCLDVMTKLEPGRFRHSPVCDTGLGQRRRLSSGRVQECASALGCRKGVGFTGSRPKSSSSPRWPQPSLCFISSEEAVWGRKWFIRASSCAGNPQQQADESVQLLPVLCLLLIRLPSLQEGCWCWFGTGAPVPLPCPVTAACGACPLD